MKLLSVNHLSKRYPGFALQQVSFSSISRADYGADWKKRRWKKYNPEIDSQYGAFLIPVMSKCLVWISISMKRNVNSKSEWYSAGSIFTL